MQTAEAQKEAPKIEPVFDEDDVPAGKLDDAEIARLVSLSSLSIQPRELARLQILFGDFMKYCAIMRCYYCTIIKSNDKRSKIIVDTHPRTTHGSNKETHQKRRWPGATF